MQRINASIGFDKRLWREDIAASKAHAAMLRDQGIVSAADAAAILGKTRTEFMVESARRQAVDVLLDQRLFMLDPSHYDAFARALDNPPLPGPKLRSLLSRVPAWRK